MSYWKKRITGDREGLAQRGTQRVTYPSRLQSAVQQDVRVLHPRRHILASGGNKSERGARHGNWTTCRSAGRCSRLPPTRAGLSFLDGGRPRDCPATHDISTCRLACLPACLHVPKEPKQSVISSSAGNCRRIRVECSTQRQHVSGAAISEGPATEDCPTYANPGS